MTHVLPRVIFGVAALNIFFKRLNIRGAFRRIFKYKPKVRWLRKHPLYSFPYYLPLLDYEMPLMNGLEATEVIRRDFLGVKVIMLTMLQSKELIESAVAKGVSGFLFKNTSLEELSDAIQRVAAVQRRALYPHDFMGLF